MAAVAPETILSVVTAVAPYCHLPIGKSDTFVQLLFLSFGELKGNSPQNVGPAFVIGFFLADQALCVYCHAFTPSKKFPLKETLTHAVWGFLNTKTYTLVVLLHMMNAGVAIPLWLWALDAYFKVNKTTNISFWFLGNNKNLMYKVTERLAYTVSRHWAHWLELFYHQHRMAHLPKVIDKKQTSVRFNRCFEGVRTRPQAASLSSWDSRL